MLSASLVFVGTLVVVIARLVWRAAPDRRLAQRFSLSTSFFALWALTLAALYEGWHLAGGIAFASTSIGTAFFVSFALLYPEATDNLTRPVRRLERVILVLGIAFAIISVFTDLIVYDTVVSPDGLSRQEGPLYLAFALYLIVGLCIAAGTLIRKLASARGLARAQLQYLALGVLIAVVGGLSTNVLFPLLTGDSSYSWLGPLFCLCYVALVAHAIIRYRLMDLRLVVHRSLTIAIATTLSLLPVCLVILIAWPTLLTDLDARAQIVLLSTLVGATLFVPITRDLASRLLDRYVYRTQANYRRTVVDASQMLTRVLDLEPLLQFIVKTVTQSTGSEGAAVYLRTSGEFRLSASHKSHTSQNFDAPPSLPANILRVVEGLRGPSLVEEVRVMGPSTTQLSEEMTRLDWFLLLPIRADNRLIGLIAIGAKLSGDPFYPQDLDLLTTLANQAGIAVKNAQLYAEVSLANEYIENIVASIESGVVAMDAFGRITIFNRAAETLTGLSATKLVGRSVHALPVALSEPLAAAVSRDRPLTIPEIEVPRSNEGTQTARPMICTTSPLRDLAGTPLGAVAVFSDLSPFKDFETARRRSERLAYFELLASGIAHEIKNPLVSIKTFVQLLPRRQQDSRFIDEFGRVAEREIGKMEQLLERLRHLSSPRGSDHKPLDVRLPLHDALTSLKAALEDKDIVVRVSSADTPKVVMGDYNELHSLFVNLILNAQEATLPYGGVNINVSADDHAVAITISDTGPGIPADVLEHIFDPFFTTKPRGSGLGLALSLGIAQSHRGQLRAANRPGGGAMFTVELPLASGVPSPVSR